MGKNVANSVLVRKYFIITGLIIVSAVTAICCYIASATSPVDKTTEEQPIIVKIEKPDDITNILLLGMDTRNYQIKSRSDSMILVSYNRTKNEARMVSFMRDSWVKIPGHKYNRLNTATAFEGPDLLIQTLDENFGVTVDHYIQIKFDDFREIIDTLDGVDIEMSKSEIWYVNDKLHTEDEDYENDIEQESGLVHLNGKQALWHCRNRTIGHADYQRTDRQRQVLTALLSQAYEKLDAKKAISLVLFCLDHVNTDMDFDALSEIAKVVFEHGLPSIEDARVPFDDTYRGANINGASVLEIDIEGNAKLVQEFLSSGWTHVEEREIVQSTRETGDNQI